MPKDDPVFVLECDRCEQPIDTDDRDFVVNHADCSEWVCRKCREKNKD